MNIPLFQCNIRNFTSFIEQRRKLA